jgi:transketolase
MMGVGKKHHFGGSLSAADVITVLYFHKMRYGPEHARLPTRDRFVMSKGHGVPAQYAALALSGVLPLEELETLKQMGSRLQGHPAMHATPGIEGCTGALGEGLSYANGIAMAGRVMGLSYDVYCLLGDGELQEGQIWEAAMTAAKHRLGNLTAIVDRNRFKAMDQTNCSKSLDPLPERWEAFRWVVAEIDGHDVDAICDALDWADDNVDQPSLIVANTIKGKGVSFFEGESRFHNAALEPAAFSLAIDELQAALHNLGG